MQTTEYAVLIGKTMTSVDVEAGDKTMTLTCDDGSVYEFYHEQYCCESVSIYDVVGDVSDLVGNPILVAEEDSNIDEPKLDHAPDSCTWTFYRFATLKGTVTIRWLGESNGYYGEGVDFRQIKP